MVNSNFIVQTLSKNKAIRTRLARTSFSMFCRIYFPDHLKYSFAPFQEEMMKYAQDKTQNNLVVTAFRGSGKSTILNMMYTIWSIMGVHNMQSVCIVSRNKDQANRHFLNIKRELETNALLRSDLGPFKDESPLWNASSLILTKYDARITAVSMEQSIRGIRHGSHRPDLFICDDLEDTMSVRHMSEREKTYNFFKSELILSGDANTRVIVLGNLLHEDSLIMKLKKEIQTGWMNGLYCEYPFIDRDETCLWPSKFPTEAAIDAEKKRVGRGDNWDREMLLKIIPTGTQVIERQWLQYHDGTFPNVVNGRTYQHTLIGVDLAISLRDTADYTAIIVADVYGGKGMKPQILIRPFPINKHMTFDHGMKTISDLIYEINKSGRIVNRVFIEDTGYQLAAVYHLQGIHGTTIIKGIHVTGDKETRLRNAAVPVQQGHVIFPPTGVDTFIHQLLGFGTEEHDDLVDAFSLLVNQFLTMKTTTIGMTTGGIHFVYDPWKSWEENQELKKQHYIYLQKKLANGELRW